MGLHRAIILLAAILLAQRQSGELHAQSDEARVRLPRMLTTVDGKQLDLTRIAAQKK